ncbi:MAG TPA: FliH/SctL family protein [Rhizomicrobium sp.]|nr:FliH/SctL family protein [Rhizomicrobium sp.]
MGTTKFTFDTVFEARQDVVSDAARARKRITLSQGELDSMLSLARNEGLGAGQVRAMEDTAHAARDTISAIDAALARLREELHAVREGAVQVALAAARRLARTALARFPHEEVEDTLRQAMHQAVGEPRLTLRAAPDVAEALKARIAEIAHDEAFDGRVQISAEPHLHGADCRIEWRGGGLERSEAAIAAALEALASRHFSTSAQES